MYWKMKQRNDTTETKRRLDIRNGQDVQKETNSPKQPKFSSTSCKQTSLSIIQANQSVIPANRARLAFASVRLKYATKYACSAGFKYSQ